jgi:PAS domain S-box-containing protein/putative nucleotidyltransferase with HDIG domain
MIEHAESGRTILVVDDEASIVRLFVRALASAGYTDVHGITDATDVPAFLDASTPDLVILDLNMPGLDGFALLQEISDRFTEDAFLPVMAVSGMAGIEARERAFRSGAKDFLAKPVNLQEFLLHVHSLLETRSQSLRLQQTQEKLAELVGQRTEELQRSVARTRQAEEALHLSEAQFRLLTQTAGVGVGFFSLDGTILFVNDAAADQIGKDTDELIGRPLAEILIPARLAETLERMETVASTGETLQFEDSSVSGGRSGWVLSTYTRVVDATDKVRGVQIVSTDITARKLAEQDLRESEERFNTAFHSSPALSTISAPDGRLVDANDAWLGALGFTREEVIGRTAVELGIVTELMVSLLREAAAGSAPGEALEMRLRTKSGDVRTVLMSAELVDIRGQKCLLAAGMDITLRTAMEQSLRLTQFCVDHAAESIIWLGPDGAVQYANDYCAGLYGYSAEELASLTLFDIDPDITPDAWASQWDAMKQQGSLSFSVRPRKKNGERFFGEVTSTYLRHGAVEQSITFLRDVTDRRLAEEALKASEARLHQMFESMSSGVLVCAAVDGGGDFVITGMNRSAEEITRVSRTRAAGLSFAALFPGVERIGLYEVLGRVWERGSPEALSARLYEDDQLRFWVENFVYKLPSAELVVMFDDVTEKQEALEELRDAYARLRNAQTGTLQALGAVTEFRDPYTAGHQQRVAKIAVLIGGRMGLSRHQLEGLRAAATVHDVGKIAVPIEILSSPGVLNEVQQALVREHVESGYEILKAITFDWPVAEIVEQHHERLDGSGYPRGLNGSEIMLEARILAVADTAEAMISHRPYRPAFGIEAALEELVTNAGAAYDAAAVEALMQLDLDTITSEIEGNVDQLEFWPEFG